ncbi:MAG: transposase, partial [Halanaerobiales bacterium]
INNYSNWDNVITIETYTQALNVTYSTYFNWQNRKKDGQLEDESFRPDNSVNTTKKENLIKALEIIFKHPDWGAKKIKQYLMREEICYLSTSTLNRIKKMLKQQLNIDNIKINQRYEFIEPNECWSLDFMEFKLGNEKLYLSFILDDKSRYILNWSITASPTFEFVKELLSKTFEQYDKPEVIKTDNGPQFRKQFRAQLKDWLITHHPNPVYCASYNGKTERKNKDLREIIDRFDDDVSLKKYLAP